MAPRQIKNNDDGASLEGFPQASNVEQGTLIGDNGTLHMRDMIFSEYSRGQKVLIMLISGLQLRRARRNNPIRVPDFESLCVLKACGNANVRFMMLTVARVDGSLTLCNTLSGL
jgi:hypothetical protein